VFFLGVFIKRVNAQGCLSALVLGFVLAMFRLAVDTPVSLGLAGFQNGYPAGSFLWVVNNIYFQYYSLLIFLICAATMVVVSYATPPPSEARIAGLTYATVTPAQERETRRSWNRWDVVNSGVVLALILAAYLYFTG
jgi:solute:Na+ symporter, SSS family